MITREISDTANPCCARPSSSQIGRPGIDLKYPVMSLTRHFVMTPLEGGLRVAGTAEWGIENGAPVSAFVFGEMPEEMKGTADTVLAPEVGARGAAVLTEEVGQGLAGLSRLPQPLGLEPFELLGHRRVDDRGQVPVRYGRPHQVLESFELVAELGRGGEVDSEPVPAAKGPCRFESSAHGD